MCNLRDYDWMEFIPPYSEYLQKELEMWHKFYPKGPGIKLDLGAGCGETANFFLLHGAEKVISIEGEPRALALLEKNFGNDKRVIIIPAMVKGIKIDIEGSEWGTVIETHNAYPRLHRLTAFGDRCALHRLDPSERPDITNPSDMRLLAKYLMVLQGRKRREWLGR